MGFGNLDSGGDLENFYNSCHFFKRWCTFICCYLFTPFPTKSSKKHDFCKFWNTLFFKKKYKICCCKRPKIATKLTKIWVSCETWSSMRNFSKSNFFPAKIRKNFKRPINLHFFVKKSSPPNKCGTYKKSPFFHFPLSQTANPHRRVMQPQM